ncbi:MAG TPA: HNH endonuclease, partial [Anaeromyxobacteraceae bacterium]|nr:HNH endonuclease [Anaeromyxobacteraceae bacterium]
MNTARDFADRLVTLLRREQGAMADFLLALAEFHAQRLWEPLGYSSLFYFLHRALKLSAGAAYHRKAAAELLLRFPEVIEPLRDGRLCLSSVVELSKVMTRENAADVLPRFFHASKQEAKAVAAEIAPREVLPERVVVTALPAPRVAAPTPSPASPPALDLPMPLHPGEMGSPPAPPPVAVRPPAPSTVEPLTADLRRLHVTVSKRFMEKLKAARDALAHSHPGADEEAVLEAGLDLLLERAAKRRALVKQPREQSDRSADDGNPRHVPAAVRREVFLRDDGRCQWPTAGGGIC